MSKRLLIFYLLVIVLMVFLPLNDIKINPNSLFFKIRMDYLFHFIIFMLWPWFILLFKIKTYIWIILGILLSLAVEGVHFFLPYRSFELNDFLANLAGLILGSVVFYLISKKLQLVFESGRIIKL